MLILRLERNGRAYERGVQAACRSPSRADRSTRSAAIIVIKRDGWYYRVERSTPHPSTPITGPVTVVPPDRARRSTGHRAEARVTGSHAPRPNLSVGHRCAAPFHEFPAKESTLTAIVATFARGSLHLENLTGSEGFSIRRRNRGDAVVGCLSSLETFNARGTRYFWIGYTK